MAHPLAGKKAPKEVLIDVAKLRGLYYDERPDPNSTHGPKKFLDPRFRTVPSKRGFRKLTWIDHGK